MVNRWLTRTMSKRVRFIFWKYTGLLLRFVSIPVKTGIETGRRGGLLRNSLFLRKALWGHGGVKASGTKKRAAKGPFFVSFLFNLPGACVKPLSTQRTPPSASPFATTAGRYSMVILVFLPARLALWASAFAQVTLAMWR